MEFSQLIKSSREAKFKSPREFHTAAKLSCTYFYYTKIEKGAVPHVDLALEITSALKINKRRGLYAWVRAQMPDAETKSMFTELSDKPARSAEQVSAQRSLVINRMQKKLLESDPLLWETILFISCYNDIKTFSVEDLAKNFKVGVVQMRKLTADLFEYGLIDKDKDGKFISKEWIFIPYEEEFHKLRQVNFVHAYSKFTKYKGPNKFRTTVTRLIDKSQVNQINSYVEAFVNSLVDMPDGKPSELHPFTVGVFASPRGFGNA